MPTAFGCGAEQHVLLLRNDQLRPVLPRRWFQLIEHGLEAGGRPPELLRIGHKSGGDFVPGDDAPQRQNPDDTDEAQHDQRHQ